MDVDRREPAGKSSLDVLVGVQTGVIAGLVMLAWFLFGASMAGRAWWLIPNLLASGIYAGRQAIFAAGMPTLAGSALLLIGAGLAGVVHAVFTPGSRLFGLAVAALSYLLCYLFLWKRIAPLMLTAAPQPLVIAGFVLYGSVLGWHPRLLRLAREHLHS